MITRKIVVPEDTVELVRDLGFQISKQRLNFESEAQTWSGYRAFLEGYFHHLRYAGAGDVSEREVAVQKYQESIDLEREYHLAGYNLGTLLYSRYTASDNEKAIEHFRRASGTTQPLLRALALAGLARGYLQQVHRYGRKEGQWVLWADEASSTAVQLAPELEDTWLARGFALQGLGRFQEAIEAYKTVVDLPGDSFQERNTKSMALNNMGYINMVHFDKLEPAEEHFGRALDFSKHNKMSHANLGEIYKRQGNYQRALSEFNQALELDPDYVNAHNEKGMLYLAMAHHSLATDSHQERAGQCHQKALSLVPEEQELQRDEVRRRFAAAYRENGFLHEAEVFEQMLREVHTSQGD